ncbi:MAG: hypothetical protein ACR2HH_02805 [Chthoniobacterales bacterium]
MSLKAFHFVFITFSILLALGIGSWCLWIDLQADVSNYLVGAVCSYLAAVVLFVYGVWFYRKMKRLRLIT